MITRAISAWLEVQGKERQTVSPETLASQNSSLTPHVPEVHTFYSFCSEETRAKGERKEMGQFPARESSIGVGVPIITYLPVP